MLLLFLFSMRMRHSANARGANIFRLHPEPDALLSFHYINRLSLTSLSIVWEVRTA